MSTKYRVIISDQARKDLIDIWQYIALDSIENANRFIDLVYEKCIELSHMPEIGRMRNELVPGIRSLPIKRYVIFYMVREKNIEIARVLSGYRDLASIF